MKRSILKIFMLFLFIHIFVLIPSIEGQAKTKIKSGTIKLEMDYSQFYEDEEDEDYVDEDYIDEDDEDLYYDYDDDEEEEENKNYQKEISIKTKKKMLLIISLDIKTINEDCEKGGIKVQLRNEKGELIQNDYSSLKGQNEGEEYNRWFYTDDMFVPAGKYKYTLINKSNADIKIKYKIVGYNKISSSIKLNKNMKIKSGAIKKIKMKQKPSGSFPMIKKISYTKGLILECGQDGNDGNIYIKGGNKPKNGTLTIKLFNGKKYKIKVKVVAGDPNFDAHTDYYYTRDNYFTVKVKNYGTSDLTIIRQGKVENTDYKTYDRTIKSMSSVTIKPGKTKTIKFYLSGSTTWYDYTDYTLFAKIKYQGKTYDWHVWSDDSVYRKGKGWYHTYANY